MKREEAKQIISDIDHAWRNFSQEEYVALDMAIKALEQEPCEDWYDVPSDEMTLGQARRAVKDLRKKLSEHLEQEPCEDVAKERYEDLCEYFGEAKSILNSREEFKKWLDRVKWHIRKAEELYEKYEYKQEPKTGHWSRKTKVDAYDIAGVKTWGIKCQCDRCDFTTIVVEDFGYYKYCPNCGCRMVEPQGSEE